MATQAPNSKFLFSIRQILAYPSSPGSFVQVWERNESTEGMFYVVADLDGMNTRRLSAADAHQYYRPPTRGEQKLVNEILFPPEPEDPNFDKEGRPIIRPDYI
ncbi:hypothetical protein [Paraburkholderia caribensis]|uniref:hypothetical protein n=1 Tax=Paraburkholderia caribensis TaxID=75105 RepID=UPI000A6158AB|nr:hypothetical protein [Paraburkholderia caribensis]